MKNLSIAFLAAVSLVTFAGCKKKAGGDFMAKAGEFRDKMCKCTDKGCADGVDADMMKWQGENKEAPKMSDEDMKKGAEIKKAYDDCKAKAVPPPPPTPAAPPAGEKPADPAAAPPAGEKPADPATPPAGEKPAGAN